MKSNCTYCSTPHGGYQIMFDSVLIVCVVLLLTLLALGVESMQVIETVVMATATVVGVMRLFSSITGHFLETGDPREPIFLYVADRWFGAIVLPVSISGLFWNDLRQVALGADVLLLLWTLCHSLDWYFRFWRANKKKNITDADCPDKIEAPQRRL